MRDVRHSGRMEVKGFARGPLLGRRAAGALAIRTALAVVPSTTVLSTDEMGRIAPPIFTSVGRDAVNAPGDVFVIQSLLNDRLPKPHSPVPVTGIADIGTILAIEAYQAVMMNMIPPSGRVEPGSATYYSLAAHPLVDDTPPHTAGHFGQLPPDVIDAAIASWKHWKVPASVTLAQWVVESAWGAAMPPGSNNPFGIKATEQQPGVDSGTHEVVNGETITITARFRRFDSHRRCVRPARASARDRRALHGRDAARREPRCVRGRADRRLRHRSEIRLHAQMGHQELRICAIRQIAP